MRINRWILVSLLAFVAPGLGSITFAGGLDSLGGMNLDSLLGKSVGLTGSQSKSCIGSMLGLAKEKLSPSDYSTVQKAVPGADKYVSDAKKSGVLSKPVGNRAGLDGVFAQLGIPKDKADKIVPEFTDLVGKAGGDKVKGLLSSVLH